MTINKSSFEQIVESFSKVSTLATKLGLLVGGICVFTYSLRINHFPQDISIGDGLLLLLAAACFGVIYIFIIACLISLGIVISPIIRRIVNLCIKFINRFRKSKLQQSHPWAPFEWEALLFSLFAVILICLLGQQNPNAYWSLPSIAVVLYIFYSLYVSCGNKLKQIENLKSSNVHTLEKENITQLGNPEILQKARFACVGTIFFVPLLLGGVSGELLDSAMRAAQVRIDKSVIYVKEPYSSLISDSAASEAILTPKDYKAFDKVTILFKGFGKTTVISFKDGEKVRNLEIPNDQLIVERQ